jgi:hypothetical protein
MLPSRRTLLQTLLGALPFLRLARASGVPDVLAGMRRTSVFQRRYRANAVVTVLGIKIFSRAGVGGGYASVETGASGDSTGVALQFSAGSWPDRAAGLNRFGILHEYSSDRADGAETAFAGFITSSKEQSLSEARSALHAPEGGVPVTLAWGATRAHSSHANTAHTAVPAKFLWTDAEAVLADLLLQAAAEPPQENRATGLPGFLAAMRQAGLSRAKELHSPFLHNGKRYELHTKWKDKLFRDMEGSIRNAQRETTAEFQVRYEPGEASGLPTRFDYHARSYLKLTFEADPSGAQPIPVLMAD